jgi:transposase-like protein
MFYILFIWNRRLSMHCPMCSSELSVKNGIVRGKQRYRCKDCGCNYTQSSLYRIPRSQREEAIKLYLEGVGFRGIERHTGISHVTVMRWVKALADRIEADTSEQDKRVAIMELDEMWHFIGKKKTNAGSGSHGTETGNVSVASN